jgi:hypothetical protein
MAEQQERKSTPQPEPRRAPEVDLRALADRVYRLMQEDLRLERARLGHAPGPRKAER